MVPDETAQMESPEVTESRQALFDIRVASGSGGPPSDHESSSEEEDTKQGQKRKKIYNGEERHSGNEERGRNIPTLERCGMIVASTSGDPPNDSDSGTSSETEDVVHDKKRDSGHKNTDKNETDRDITTSKIDADIWKTYVESGDVDGAMQLVNDRVLPNQDVLDSASVTFGNSSELIQKICTAICCYIKNSCQNIIHVWASRDDRENQDSKDRITFVVITKDSSEIETQGYRCYQTRVNEISDRCSAENTHISKLEQDCPKNYSETQNVKRFLNKYTKSLMENHTNVTRISMSWFKSKGYGTENQSVTRKMCIAVYVQTKGLIPLNESALQIPTDEIDLDVRESVVMSYALPNEYHKHLKIGCAIHGNLSFYGTLGGFIEEDEKVYCLSCAHVFLSNEELFKLKTQDFVSGDRLFDAYQPPSDMSNETKYFGKGIRAVNKEGGNPCGDSGVEAVVIQLETRLPLLGDFPDSPCAELEDAGFDIPRSFSSGKICNREEIQRLLLDNKLAVLKFGCETGWTRGCIRSDCGSLRYRASSEYPLTLYNQFEIQNIGGKPFALEGDSGTLVYTEENGELSAIGMVEGGEDNVVFVTPICEVFTALGYQGDKMKQFPLSAYIDKKLKSLEKLVATYLDDKLKPLWTAINAVRMELEALKTETRI